MRDDSFFYWLLTEPEGIAWWLLYMVSLGTLAGLWLALVA